MNRKTDIVKMLQEMSGKYSTYEIFTDWIRCMALSIEQSTHFIRDEEWHRRERDYINTMNKYSYDERMKLAERV